ncbi:flippase-like domain-containing protein [bacterium]|nr:flippase-like domain-containing protein [bacterium]
MTRDPGRGGSLRGGLVLLAKLVVSAGLIAFVLSRISLTEITATMESPRWGYLLLALAVYGLSAVGGAVQWSWILRAAGITAPGREIRRIYFIGLFFNNFLPANVGGDAWKIIDLGRQQQRRLGVFCATLLDRLIGLGALALLAVVMLLAASLAGIPLPAISLVMLPVLALLGGVIALLLSRRLGVLLDAVLRRLRLPGLADQVARITGELALYRRRVRWLQGVFLFSVLVQGLRMATHLVVAWGLGFVLDVSQMVQLLVLIPLLAVSLTLPVTINGIGLRESISANLLVWAGLAAPQAVAMEVAAYLVQVVFSLQGGILLWVGRWSRKESPGTGTSVVP